jgi:hypothetical protein
MGFTFYLAIINNIFSIAGLAGVLNAQVQHECSNGKHAMAWGESATQRQHLVGSTH